LKIASDHLFFSFPFYDARYKYYKIEMPKKECKKKKSNKKASDIVKMKYSCSKCGLKSAKEKSLCRPEELQK
jgi:hypothetical protein